MKIKNLISFLFFVFITISSNAVPIQYDSSSINHRKFDTKNIEQLKKNHKYDYGKEQIAKKPSNNYLQKLIQQFFEKLYRTIFSSWKEIGVGAMIFRIILYIIFIIFIIYLLLQIFNIKDIFGKNKKIIDLPYDIENENIHELDFNQLIAKALEEHQYRLAIRLQYLNSIKKLSDSNLIQWSIEKTNMHYIIEINSKYKNDFISLTQIFDWVWYGEYLVDKNEYEKFAIQFNNFNKSIS